MAIPEHGEISFIIQIGPEEIIRKTKEVSKLRRKRSNLKWST